MLVEQVDGVDLQVLQRRLRADSIRTAVETAGLSGTEVEAELCGDDDAFPKRFQCLAYKFLVGERAVDLGGVEECNAALHRRPDKRDHFLACRSRSTMIIQSHAAPVRWPRLWGPSRQVFAFSFSVSLARAVTATISPVRNIICDIARR